MFDRDIPTVDGILFIARVKGCPAMNLGDVMVVLNLASVALCLIVAVLAIRHIDISASRPVAALLLLAAGWSLTEVLILAVPTPEFKFELLFFQNALVTFIPLIWILVAQAVTGNAMLARRVWLGLTCCAVSLAMLCQTNHWHSLILADLMLEVGDRYPTFEYGALFLVFAVYGYSVLFYGATRLWQARQSSSGPRRLELSLWLLCVAVPTLVDLISFTPVFNSIEGKLTPMALALSTALAGWGLIRRQLFRVEPVALEKAFESMRDGVLMIDRQGRVARLNNAAKAFTVLSAGQAVGEKIARVLPEWSDTALGTPFEVSVNGRILEYSGDPIAGGGFVVIVRDLTALRRYEQQLLEGAMRDSLTALYNRRAFLDRADGLIAQHANACLVYLDLDRFKQVNDSLGHEGGDALLTTVARRLEGALDGHLLARVGGDEFVALIVLPAPSVRDLMVRLEQSITQPAHVLGQTVTVGLSWGLAVYPRDGLQLETLLRVADTAMYFQKRARKSLSASQS